MKTPEFMWLLKEFTSFADSKKITEGFISAIIIPGEVRLQMSPSYHRYDRPGVRDKHSTKEQIVTSSTTGDILFLSQPREVLMCVCLAGYLDLIPILRKIKQSFTFLYFYLFSVRCIWI